MNNKRIQSIFFAIILVFYLFDGLAQTSSKYIVVDQFGYLPTMQKVAVIRDPKVGFDAEESFTPGLTYAVVNADNDEVVFEGSLELWNGGATDASSGDKAWWFDFSEVTDEGSYYLLDTEKEVRSAAFDISPSIYNRILKQAVRTFFYQRAGFPKSFPYASLGWTDEASHLGPLQDTEARIYDSKSSASTQKDLSGGWYDAGDYNKYTNWTANYVVNFMRAYLENPTAWGDDYNIPESGNGTPDLLDEAKWGIDHLLRMQEDDGSVLSIVSLASGSPPSSATGQSLYGSASTSATLNTAAAFAIASKVFSIIGMEEYSDQLLAASEKAWEWAEANHDVVFFNNDAAYGTSGIGAGQQEVDDYGRLIAKLEAAVFLFEVTGKEPYKTFFDSNYDQVHLMQWNFAYPYEVANQEVLLYYTRLEGAEASIKEDILFTYKAAMQSENNFQAVSSEKDPYRAHLDSYTWGSNGVKCLKGIMFTDMVYYQVDATQDESAYDAALDYLHYLHGVNPLGMVYLSNMYDFGAEYSVNEFYHTWFTNGSEKWDRVGESTYGPAPGFLTGGPNPSYDWDGCCPDNCGGSNNQVCTSESLTPPKGQPKQKSYKDFNTSWPLNSWSVTENSDGYQIYYIRLLSKFVDGSFDCSGVKDGSAFFDACGSCAGGTTGVEPTLDPEACEAYEPLGNASSDSVFSIFPNPSSGQVQIKTDTHEPYAIKVLDQTGKTYHQDRIRGDYTLDIQNLSTGIFYVIIETREGVTISHKVVKK